MISKQFKITLTALLFTLILCSSTLANCFYTSSGGSAALASAIHLKVSQLEKERPQPKTRPTIAVQVKESLEAPNINAGDTAIQSSLKDIACLNNERILRDIRTSANTSQLPLAFVSNLSDELARQALDRISKIGSNNMDPQTANIVKARDINYVVVIGGNLRAKPYRCTFDFEWNASIDIHSVATREVVTVSKNLDRLEPKNNSSYLKLTPNTVQKRLVLKSNSSTPVCLGQVEIETKSSSGSPYYNWNQNVGCIKAGGEAYIRAPSQQTSGTGWANVGEITIAPIDSCDLFLEDNFPIAAIFGGSSSSGSQPPIGLPTGHSMPCGCYGTAILNQPFPSTACASGRAINNACGFTCPSGGWSYSPRCIP